MPRHSEYRIPVIRHNRVSTETVSFPANNPHKTTGRTKTIDTTVDPTMLSQKDRLRLLIFGYDLIYESDGNRSLQKLMPKNIKIMEKLLTKLEGENNNKLKNSEVQSLERYKLEDYER